MPFNEVPAFRADRWDLRELAEAGVVEEETGAAALHDDASTAEFRASGLLGTDKTLLVLVTEGATDRGNYQSIVGRPPEGVGTILSLAR